MVEPLRKRTMTLGKLQLRTLDMIRKVRFQLLGRQVNNMTDQEFIDNFLEPFEYDIYADREVLKIAKTKDGGK